MPAFSAMIACLYDSCSCHFFFLLYAKNKVWLSPNDNTWSLVLHGIFLLELELSMHVMSTVRASTVYFQIFFSWTPSIIFNDTNVYTCWMINLFILYNFSSFCRRGLTDELGAEAMMMDALDKVENEIGKPLMRNDKKSMAILTGEFDKINKK